MEPWQTAPLWCQPGTASLSATNLSLQTSPSAPSPHILPFCLLNPLIPGPAPMQTPKSLIPSPLTSPAGSPTPSPTLPICPERLRGPSQHEATLACLTMRMSAVMAQLENSSVSPTKMQICPGETRATIRGRSTRHWPQAAPCTLTAGREPPEAFPPAPGGQAHGEFVD